MQRKSKIIVTSELATILPQPEIHCSMVSKKAMSAYNKGLIASAALLLVMSLQCFAQKPIKTTLCAILRNPQRFHRVLVEFQSKYDVGFENPILEDAECENGIVASFTGKLHEEEKLKNVCKDKPGTVGTLNAAIWLGVFRYHPNAVSTWTLDVRQVRVLTFSCLVNPFGGGIPVLNKPIEPNEPNGPIQLPESPSPTWPPK